MNNFIKGTMCLGLTSVLAFGTFLTAGAVKKYSKDNTGNSVYYGKSLDFSLGSYVVKPPVSSWPCICSDHDIYLKGNTVSITPCGSKTKNNSIWWYAEWKANDGKDYIISKIEKWETIKNNDTWKRDLSDEMGLRTRDSDITYISYKVMPKPVRGENKTLITFYSEDEESDYMKVYSRRASTDIKHKTIRR